METRPVIESELAKLVKLRNEMLAVAYGSNYPEFRKLQLEFHDQWDKCRSAGIPDSMVIGIAHGAVSR